MTLEMLVILLISLRSNGFPTKLINFLNRMEEDENIPSGWEQNLMLTKAEQIFE